MKHGKMLKTKYEPPSSTQSVFTVRLVKKAGTYSVLYWYGDGEMTILARLEDKERAIKVAKSLEESLSQSVGTPI
jgi:hypothetical protein